jgi:hypothetical protein
MRLVMLAAYLACAATDLLIANSLLRLAGVA